MYPLQYWDLKNVYLLQNKYPKSVYPLQFLDLKIVYPLQ